MQSLSKPVENIIKFDKLVYMKKIIEIYEILWDFMVKDEKYCEKWLISLCINSVILSIFISKEHIKSMFIIKSR